MRRSIVVVLVCPYTGTPTVLTSAPNARNVMINYFGRVLCCGNLSIKLPTKAQQVIVTCLWVCMTGVWEHLQEKVWNSLKGLKRCAFQCTESLKMGFCEEQNSLKSYINLNSHIPDVSVSMGANPGGGGGGGGQGDVSPTFLKVGDTISNVLPRFWGWMIIHLYNDPFYMVCDIVDPFSFFFFACQKGLSCRMGTPTLCQKKLSHKIWVEKKSVGVPPPLISFFWDLHNFRGWRRSGKKMCVPPTIRFGLAPMSVRVFIQQIGISFLCFWVWC